MLLSGPKRRQGLPLASLSPWNVRPCPSTRHTLFWALKHHYHVASFMKVSLICAQAANVPTSVFSEYLLSISSTCGRQCAGNNSRPVTFLQSSICKITKFTFRTFVPHSGGPCESCRDHLLFNGGKFWYSASV